MGKATRATVDTAGGGLIASTQSFATSNGAPLALLGAAVASHGSSPHDAATMVEASSFVTVNGTAVVLEGKLASCGDAATGSGPVTISS